MNHPSGKARTREFWKTNGFQYLLTPDAVASPKDYLSCATTSLNNERECVTSSRRRSKCKEKEWFHDPLNILSQWIRNRRTFHFSLPAIVGFQFRKLLISYAMTGKLYKKKISRERKGRKEPLWAGCEEWNLLSTEVFSGGKTWTRISDHFQF